MVENLDLFKRSNFYNGLMATPNFWNDTQNYHLLKERFYNQVFHGAGVVPEVTGELNVFPVKKSGNLTIMVEPGFAIDQNGRGLFLYEPVAKVIDYKNFKLPCTIYVVISYNEVMDEFFQNKENPEFQGYQKKIETAIVEITDKLPDNRINIELARIFLKEDEQGDIKEIKAAEDFANPHENEIDKKFVLWTTAAKRGISPHMKKFLNDVLEDTKNTAVIANDSIKLPSLRELQTIALTAKMLIMGNIGFDDIVNILYPIFDVNNHVLQEMLELEKNIGRRVYSEKDNYAEYRNNVYEMGNNIKYYDNKIESLDKVLKSLNNVLASLKSIVFAKQLTFDDITMLSDDLPQFLVVNNVRYTMVEFVDFNDFDSDKSHEFNTENVHDLAVSKHSFTYPDGISVVDTVKRFVGGTVSFKIRNLIRKRELVMIRRTDIFHGNYSVDVLINDKPVKQLAIDGYDSVNRWRNLYMIFEEFLIENGSAKISFKMAQAGRDNFGKLWFYQKI